MKSSTRAIRFNGDLIRIQVPTEGLLTIDDALASEKVQNSIQDKFGFKNNFIVT